MLQYLQIFYLKPRMYTLNIYLSLFTMILRITTHVFIDVKRPVLLYVPWK